MPELFVLNGVAAGTVFVLGDVPAVVGRSPEAHLRIADPWISSMHAMFERRGDAVWVVDLESRNGVFVGEDRIAEALVADGAVVRLGRTDVRFTRQYTSIGDVARAREARETPPPPPSRRAAVRTEATLSTGLPLVRERPEDPVALAARPATVLRVSIDAAGLEPSPEASDRVRAALDAVSAAALDEGGVVARLAGIGILALFGLGGPSPDDDAASALRAARAARRALRAAGGLELRAGIDAGPVLAGNTAGPAGFELTALGPAAERAERLLALAGPGEIVAGPGAGPATGLPRHGLVRLGPSEVEVFRDRGA